MRTIAALLLMSAVVFCQEKEGPIRRETSNPTIKTMKDLFASFPRECVVDKPDDYTQIQYQLGNEWGKDQVAVPIEFNVPMKVNRISPQSDRIAIEFVGVFKKGEAPFKYWKTFRTTYYIKKDATDELRKAAGLKEGKSYQVSGTVFSIQVEKEDCHIDLKSAQVAESQPEKSPKKTKTAAD